MRRSPDPQGRSHEDSAEFAFTPAVRAVQETQGSRATNPRMQTESEPGDGLGSPEAEFVSSADGFQMATVSETGCPYIQHRGGARGFLRVPSPARVAFADFGGKWQYVTAGDASRDGRVAATVVDYGHQPRLKRLGHLRFEDVGDADPARVFAVELPGYRARLDRIAVVDIEAFDWNCSQHIARRFTVAEIEEASQPLRERMAQLETEMEGLRAQAASRT
jgi:hypothetical protein